MADLQTQIAITADASGVEAGVGKAKRSLADLGATAAAAGRQASEGLSGAGAGADGAGRKIDAATKNIIGSIQRQIATMEAGSKTGSKYFEAIANQRGANLDALRPYLAQLDQVQQKQQTVAEGFAKLGAQGRANLDRLSLGDKLTQGLSTAGREAKVAADSLNQASKTSTVALNGIQLSAKQTAQALRLVPAQFTDIATSLAAGQSPLTVLLQQGGQLKDSFGGIAPAAQALGRYITGLINPFTVAAGAAGLLAVAYNQGSKEADAYAKAIILTGNAAGTTIGQLQAQAAAISQVVGTQGQAAEALAEFASQGNVAGENLQRFATVAIRMQRVAGQAVADTAKQFGDLAKEPLAAALKLNEGTNFLTKSLYEQIKALDETGKTADAAAVAQRAYAEALESRAGQLEDQLGAIQHGWNAVKDAASAAWNAMLNVGRPDTLQQQLTRAQQALETARATENLPINLRGDQEDSTALELRVKDLQERIRLENSAAEAAKKSAEQVKARVQFDKEGEQFLSKQVRLERDIAKAKEDGARAGASQAEIEKRVADIRAKYADKGSRPRSNAGAAAAIDRSELAFDLGKIKAESDQLVNIYNNSERVLEALRSAGLVDEREYYEAKRGFINLESQAKEEAARKEIDRLQQERLSGKEAIDRDRKVAEVQARLALDKANASSQLEVLAIQEEAAVKRLGLAYLTARQAAQDYYDTTQRQQQRQLEGVGQGNERRARNAGVSQIEDRFADQRRELENQKAQLEFEGKFTEEARKQYEQRLGLIYEFQDKSIASFNDYYDKLLKKQQDFTVGVSEATKNYISESKNIAQQTEEIFSNAFGNLEDLIADFILTGKGSFKDFADSIVRDITRATAKQALGRGLELLQGQAGSGGLLGSLGTLLGGAKGTGESATISTAIATSATASATAITTAIGLSTGAIVGAISASKLGDAAGGASSLFDAGSGFSFGDFSGGFGDAFGGFFADGGDPPMGKVSVVGERGPELFIPKSRGTIVPMDKAVGGSQEDRRAVSVTINQNFPQGTGRQTVDQAAVAASAALRRAVARGTA